MAPVEWGHLEEQHQNGGEPEMLNTITARQTAHETKVTVCALCRGCGHDPRVPHRPLPHGEVMYLVKPCPNCGGHGTMASTGDRDLALV